MRGERLFGEIRYLSSSSSPWWHRCCCERCRHQGDAVAWLHPERWDDFVVTGNTSHYPSLPPTPIKLIAQVGNLRVDPRLHPTSVGYNLGSTRDFPTSVIAPRNTQRTFLYHFTILFYGDSAKTKKNNRKVLVTSGNIRNLSWHYHYAKYINNTRNSQFWNVMGYLTI